MKIRESESVLIKRRGAEYVSKMLKGKNKQEQLDFWKERTDILINRQKNSKLKKESNFTTV